MTVVHDRVPSLTGHTRSRAVCVENHTQDLHAHAWRGATGWVVNDDALLLGSNQLHVRTISVVQD